MSTTAEWDANADDCFKQGYSAAKEKAVATSTPEVTFKLPQDANVCAVLHLLASRADVGLKKYGVTTERQDLSVIEWLDHLQCELGDAMNYIQKLKGVLAPLFPAPTKPFVTTIP